MHSLVILLYERNPAAISRLSSVDLGLGRADFFIHEVLIMCIKKNIVRAVLCIQLSLYTVFYYYGQQGIQQIESMKHANLQTEQQIVQLQSDIETLTYELAQWHTFPFYKEKLAREQLQMARVGDIIYYIQ